MNSGMPNGGPINVGNLSAMNVAGFAVAPNPNSDSDGKLGISSSSMVPGMVTSGIVTMAGQPQPQLFVGGGAALMPGHQFGQFIFPQALPQHLQGQAQLIHQQPQLIQQQIQLQHPQQHQLLQSQEQIPGAQQAIALAIAPNPQQHMQGQAGSAEQQSQQQSSQQQQQQQGQQGQQQQQPQVVQQNPADPNAVTPKKKKKKSKKKSANATSPSMVPVGNGNVPDQKMPQMPYNVTCNDSDLEAFLAYQRLCTTHLDLKSKLQLLYNSKQTCQVCHREYDGFSKLRRHLLSHTDFRPYKCEHCPKSFASLSQLKRHDVTHAGLKLYKCPLCDTSVSRKEHLKRHMLTHSELKPYKCSQCDHSARRLDSLHHHIRQRHAEGAQVMYLRPETCEFEVKSVVDARSPDWIPKKKKKYPKKKKNKVAAAALAAANQASDGAGPNSVDPGTPKAAPPPALEGVPADIKPEMMPTTSIEAIHQANHSLIKEWEQSYFSQIFSHLGPGGTPVTTTTSTAAAVTPGASNPKPQEGDAPPKKKKKKKKKKKSQSSAAEADGNFPNLTPQAYTIPNYHGGSLDGQTGQFLPITSEGTVAAQMNASTVLTTAHQQQPQSQGSMQGMAPAGDNISGLQQHSKNISSSKRSHSVDNMAPASSGGGSGDGNNTPVMTSSGMYVPPQQGTPPVNMSCMTPTPKPDGQFVSSDPNMASNGGSSDPMTIKQENLQHSILGHPRFSSASQNPHASPLPQNVNFSGVPPGHLYPPQQCYPQPPFGEQMPPGVAVSMPNNLGMQSSASAFQSVYAGGTYEAAHQQMVAGKYFGPAPNPPYDTGPFNAVGPTMGQIPAFFRKRISQGCRQLNEMASFHLRPKQPNS